MKNWSILKMNVRIISSVPKLVTIPNFTFFWTCLIPKWQHVTFLWITDEELLNFKNKRQNWILRSQLLTIPNLTFFWPCLIQKWQHVTFLWIINEELVNFKNECHNWILRPKISHSANFYLFLTLFDTKVTTCHFFINNWCRLSQC